MTKRMQKKNASHFVAPVSAPFFASQTSVLQRTMRPCVRHVASIIGTHAVILLQDRAARLGDSAREGPKPVNSFHNHRNLKETAQPEVKKRKGVSLSESE